MQCVHYCVRNANIPFLGFVLAVGADVNARAAGQGHTPLHIAACQDSPDVLSFLLRRPGIDPDLRGRGGETPLIWAARRGLAANVTVWCAESLVPALNAVDSNGITALHAAACNNKVDIVRHLAALPGVDPGVVAVTGRTAIDSAAKFGYDDVVDILLGLGAKALKDGSYGSLVVIAVARGNIPLLRKLVEKFRADVNVTPDPGVTAMGWAVAMGKREVMEYLVRVPGRRLGKLPARGNPEGDEGEISSGIRRLLEEMAPDLMC
jgi:ankyrin repeat protein